MLPCYNEAKSIVSLVERYRLYADTRGLLNEHFELVLVNNGSTDDTPLVLSNLIKSGCDFVTLVTIPVNQGYGHGLLTGLKKARFETVAYSHADEQCNPLDVFLAYDMSKKQGGILVKGKRRKRALKDKLFTWGYEFCVFCITGKYISEINAQPKLFPKYLVSKIAEKAPTHFAFDLHVLLCAQRERLTFKEFEVIFPPRMHGESKWASTLRSKLRHIRLVIQYLIAVKESA